MRRSGRDSWLIKASKQHEQIIKSSRCSIAEDAASRLPSQAWAAVRNTYQREGAKCKVGATIGWVGKQARGEGRRAHSSEESTSEVKKSENKIRNSAQIEKTRTLRTAWMPGQIESNYGTELWSADWKFVIRTRFFRTSWSESEWDWD